ncbi:diacylglycerol acyltransferase [Gigaspora margarita]|uniref:Diacylglycerol O-acyltransferase n=1 Tax=Gigaspora margarita TaxID=4874 RepID=A0A8H4A7C4_GIGMA|nr:diacylglycerol acyltransferase [Gigaspora margarita]
MVNSPKIRLAPLNVPFERRIQTAATALWLVSLPLTILIFFISCTIIFLWPLIIPYLLFILFDIAPENGGRRYEFARRAKFWKWYSDYFPAKLIKQVDLDPSKNYVFGNHPHGVISVGGWITFATESTGFSELFPGITCRMLTLTTNFNIPLYRDYLMAQGLASVSRQSCMNILRRGPGNSVMIVVGGAGESLSARPGINDLILKKRLGFIKIAIVSGASLCPVFSFGENDIWDQADNPEGSMLWRFQKSVQKLSGWTLPLFHGRGIFNYDWGFLPHRRPIVTVVGKPIDVVQNDNPTEEQLLEVQKKYIAELYEIWDNYKDIYAKNRKRELTLIE